VATLIRDRDGWVEGLLYELPLGDLAVLDRYEGHPFAYPRKLLLVTEETGHWRRAHVYVLTSDGRVFEGTPKQIVEAMQYIAVGQENRTLGEYIDWLVGQVERLEQTPLKVEGDTDEEKAASLVEAMLANGLAVKM